MADFTHPDYEYQTLTVPFDTKALRAEYDRTINQDMGFTRVWADVTENGIFIVYRRKRGKAQAGMRRDDDTARAPVECAKVAPDPNKFRVSAMGPMPIQLDGQEVNRLVDMLTRLTGGQESRLRVLVDYTPLTYGGISAARFADSVRNLVNSARTAGWDGNLVRIAEALWPKETGFASLLTGLA